MGPFRSDSRPFSDRDYAGRHLASHLTAYRHQPDSVVVLGLARGGVPIAAAVARALDAPFDALVVRKLGVPDQEELAFGALAAHGPDQAEVLMDEVLATLPPERRRKAALDEVRERESRELRRRQLSYLRRRGIDVGEQNVILCDDGLATGASMLAAIKVIRQGHPDRVIVASPVGPPRVCAELAAMADELVCPLQPEEFGAGGEFYANFAQVSDEDVLRLLGG
ncbi:MAG: phosphoribosyl transferase [Micrococcaceae bacterium]|nr:phosphoribosyl transferase [Micrococcaceae bacterium]